MNDNIISANDINSVALEKPISDVDIKDDQMFSHVMKDREICMEMLRYLLPEWSIADIKYVSEGDDGSDEDDGESIPFEKRNKPDAQKVVVSEADKRGVRLDVYLDDGHTIYNIEMQTTKDPHIAQRTRLYQAHLDIDQLERGYAYSRLRPSFIIFICTFDPFGEDLCRYTFENTCREKVGMSLKDEAYKVFFNVKGTHGDIELRLRELLDYINDPKNFPVDRTGNRLIKKLDEAVNMAKHDEEWRREYMMSQVREGILKEQYLAKGIEQGLERGKREEKKAIVSSMLKEGLPIDMIARLTGLEQAEVKKIDQQRHMS